jgi:hypothetical protein
MVPRDERTSLPRLLSSGPARLGVSPSAAPSSLSGSRAEGGKDVDMSSGFRGPWSLEAAAGATGKSTRREEEQN